MSWRASLRLIAVLPLGVASGACGPSDSGATPPPAACSGTPQPLAPGELVAGQDPAELLAPYWRSFDGTLSWTDGGDTPFTLSLAQGSDTDVFASPLCATPDAIYTYPNIGLTTQDGGLAETDVGILNVPLPNAPGAAAATVLGPSVLPDSQWQGAITEHLPGNSESYDQRGLLPLVDWTASEPGPSAMLLYFYAQPKGTTVYDQILIASVTFP